MLHIFFFSVYRIAGYFRGWKFRSIRPPELNFVVLNMGGNMNFNIWTRVRSMQRFGRGSCVREATTSMEIFERLVNARIAPVLIRLLWLLPSVVKERGTSLAVRSCLRLLHFAVYFVNQRSFEGGPCGYGALSTGCSSETEPYLSSSISSLQRKWKTSWVQNFVTPGLVKKITKISTPRK